MRQILVERSMDRLEFALIEDRELIDFRSVSFHDIQAGQVYLGIVDRVMKGINAAYVKLSGTMIGFLPLSETKQSVKAGDHVLVQVKKPPISGKDAYLTQDISLVGADIILLPMSRRFAVSQKIMNDDEKAALNQRARMLCPQNMGLILRHTASACSDECLKAQIEEQKMAWAGVLSAVDKAQAPALIADDSLNFLKEFRNVTSVTVNDEHDLGLFREEDLRKSVLEHPFDLMNVRGQLRKACAHRVWLKCGGFLVIDLCEAMTVIDVNTGKFAGNKSGTEDTFLKVNLEAASEIARLMRLRNMGGIIIVDFIDMKQESSREQVIDRMRECVFHDPVKVVVHGFTDLGLMELTRKKVCQALEIGNESLCPYCHGTGIVHLSGEQDDEG